MRLWFYWRNLGRSLVGLIVALFSDVGSWPMGTRGRRNITTARSTPSLGWGVFAPTTGVAPGALAGQYVGVTGDVGFGIGGGANVLVGGAARTFVLQPLSLQGSIAVDAVLGLSSLKLRPAAWR